MKTVSLIIELKDKFSGIIKKNIEFAGKLSKEMKVVQSQTKKYQDLCSRLEMPNLNAMLQVAESIGNLMGKAMQGQTEVLLPWEVTKFSSRGNKNVNLLPCYPLDFACLSFSSHTESTIAPKIVLFQMKSLNLHSSL